MLINEGAESSSLSKNPTSVEGILGIKKNWSVNLN